MLSMSHANIADCKRAKDWMPTTAGLEPAALVLGGLCSTIEPRSRTGRSRAFPVYNPAPLPAPGIDTATSF